LFKPGVLGGGYHPETTGRRWGIFVGQVGSPGRRYNFRDLLVSIGENGSIKKSVDRNASGGALEERKDCSVDNGFECPEKKGVYIVSSRHKRAGRK